MFNKKPKVHFRYSYIYDVFCQEKYSRRDINTEKCRKYIPEFELIWRTKENKILNEISKITKLKWELKELQTYIVTYCQPFSDPLTIPILYYNEPEIESQVSFQDCLIHELVNQIFAQNKEFEHYMYFTELQPMYSNDSIETIVHIPLFAVLKELYLKLFSLDDWERVIRKYYSNPNARDYQRALGIINEKGHKYFLEKLFENK